MAHLIKLEFRKLPFMRYLLISAFLMLLGMFFVFVASNDSSAGRHTYGDAFRTVEMIFLILYVIFFAVLNVAMVLSEYSSRTILLMFTYPIDKRKLILAKLVIITGFIAASMLLGYVLCGSFIVLLDSRFDMIQGDFSREILAGWLWGAAATTIVFCCLGLLSFAAGMIKKSPTVAFVSSVILIFLRQAAVTADGSGEESAYLVLAALAVTAAALWYVFSRKITQLE